MKYTNVNAPKIKYGLPLLRYVAIIAPFPVIMVGAAISDASTLESAATLGSIFAIIGILMHGQISVASQPDFIVVPSWNISNDRRIWSYRVEEARTEAVVSNPFSTEAEAHAVCKILNAARASTPTRLLA